MQLGSSEWVTIIIAVNAKGWLILLFIIFKGAQHYNTWHEAVADRPSWLISVSEKGWTSNEHGLQWLKHFNSFIKERSRGSKCLLVMDGYASHDTLEFR
jgi:hypothetical protein